MKEEILKLCLEKGILLDKEIFEILSKLDFTEAKKLVESLSKYNEKIITRSFFSKNMERISGLDEGKRIIEKLGISLMKLEITREKIEKKTGSKEDKRQKMLRNVKVISSIKEQAKKIEVADFVRHFRSRLSFLKNILQERQELENLTSVNKIAGSRQNFSIIGMVSGKRITKSKNILMTIEDLTGELTCMVNANKPELYEIAKDIILDDVIAVKGSGSREIMFLNNVFYPEARNFEKAKLDRDESAAFISDIHAGSKMFLKQNFLKFIEWINGEIGSEEQKKEARKIKYLFITGDSVEGVGVYPGQEALLEIKDVKLQYQELAKLLGKIRKDVTIIHCPGQHDAVWVGEPQPAVSEEYASALFELENMLFVSNPAMVEITNNFGKGIRILMYHGASFVSYASEIESLRTCRALHTPSKIVREVLKRRHLASFHSSVTYTPNGTEDSMLIKETPDIIATADLHKSEVDVCNNILIICSSCWQSMTPFEEKVGNHPEPCKVPVLNLKTRQIKILDFSEEAREKEKCEEKEEKMVCEVKK